MNVLYSVLQIFHNSLASITRSKELEWFRFQKDGSASESWRHTGNYFHLLFAYLSLDSFLPLILTHSAEINRSRLLRVNEPKWYHGLQIKSVLINSWGANISQWIQIKIPRIDHTTQFRVQSEIQPQILTSKMVRSGWIDAINTVTAKNFIVRFLHRGAG